MDDFAINSVPENSGIFKKMKIEENGWGDGRIGTEGIIDGMNLYGYRYAWAKRPSNKNDRCGLKQSTASVALGAAYLRLDNSLEIDLIAVFGGETVPVQVGIVGQRQHAGAGQSVGVFAEVDNGHTGMGLVEVNAHERIGDLQQCAEERRAETLVGKQSDVLSAKTKKP